MSLEELFPKQTNMNTYDSDGFIFPGLPLMCIKWLLQLGTKFGKVWMNHHDSSTLLFIAVLEDSRDPGVVDLYYTMHCLSSEDIKNLPPGGGLPAK